MPLNSCGARAIGGTQERPGRCGRGIAARAHFIQPRSSLPALTPQLPIDSYLALLFHLALATLGSRQPTAPVEISLALELA